MSKKGKKYYAVKVGETPGIYTTWDDCNKQVNHFPGAKFKSFQTKEEAEAYMEENDTSTKEETFDESNLPTYYAFVDGSYNEETKTYGYGGYLMNGEEKIVLKGKGCDKDMASMRNVAGEIAGAMAALKKAKELNLPEITIYYDYEGIRSWAYGLWKTTKEGTKAYADYTFDLMGEMMIKFVHVKGHSGIPGNEEADDLAKESVGLL